MEHPFLSSQSLVDLSIDELQTKISDLYKKLRWAQSVNHPTLTFQVSMALESYNTAYKTKVSEALEKRNIGNSIVVSGQKD